MPTARDPHSANSPTMHSSWLAKTEIIKLYSNISYTLFDKKSPAIWFPIVHDKDIIFYTNDMSTL